MLKSKVLIVGGIGKRLVKASLDEGHETYLLLSFKEQGANLVTASFHDHHSPCQFNLSSFMLSRKPEIARFLPSEFGMDPGRMEHALEPGRATFDDKMVVRKAIEEAKIPHTSASKKFKPTDEELIQDFLLNKINGRPLPNNGTILEGELFGTEKNPWKIWEENVENSYDGKDLYFFTTLKRKFSTNSLRMVRTIGLGFWEGEDIGKEIMANKTNQRIGMRKRYRFEKSGTSHDGGWILHQYSIDSSLLPNPSNNANDYAGKVEFVNQSENGDERMEIQNESPNQSDKANQSENNGDEKIDEIQRELTNQLENNDDEIQVEAFDTTIGIEANYGNVKAITVVEDDIAKYTIKTIDDPKILNKTVYIRPPKNILSPLEIVQTWKKLIGKELKKSSISDEQFLSSMKRKSYAEQVAMVHYYHVCIEGCLANFEIGDGGVEACELYSEVKYTTVHEYMKRYL
ncbi:hypothetical protein Ahy_A07g033440 [Arachis hypogaea]|uniref:(+)-lariciresinol reductase n=1 Tax=Arachis hypogaea TaxID=3818 RepID=A0A445C995_ARAHY|nr:hypothetical protein Ahy_A07g033440 [Arachis hypogaea]